MAAAAAGLSDEKYYLDTSRRIIATRERVSAELVKMGFKVLPSAANFIFSSPPNGNAQELYAFCGNMACWLDISPETEWINLYV